MYINIHDVNATDDVYCGQGQDYWPHPQHRDLVLILHSLPATLIEAIEWSLCKYIVQETKTWFSDKNFVFDNNYYVKWIV